MHFSLKSKFKIIPFPLVRTCLPVGYFRYDDPVVLNFFLQSLRKKFDNPPVMMAGLFKIVRQTNQLLFIFFLGFSPCLSSLHHKPTLTVARCVRPNCRHTVLTATAVSHLENYAICPPVRYRRTAESRDRTNETGAFESKKHNLKIVAYTFRNCSSRIGYRYNWIY